MTSVSAERGCAVPLLHEEEIAPQGTSDADVDADPGTQRP